MIHSLQEASATKQECSRKERPKEVNSSRAPPPVADSSLWPTPDTAKDQGTKKPHEKAEKADRGEAERPQAANAKAHKKEKWTPVAYTPSVIFETQLNSQKPGKPARGGRWGGSGGGGRGSGANGGGGGGNSGGSGQVSNGNARGERVSAGPAASTSGAETEESNARGRGEVSSTKTSPSSLDRMPKRAMSAGPPMGREQRRPMPPPSSPEKRRESDLTGVRNPERRSGAPVRRTSNATQPENFSKGRQDSRPNGRAESSYQQPLVVGGPERSQLMPHDSQTHQRNTIHDRRNEGMNRVLDHSRDISYHGNPRDRGLDRGGRGSFRGGRGGGGGVGGGGGGGSNGYPGASHHPPAVFPNGGQPGPPNHPSSSLYVAGKPPAFNTYHHPSHGRQSSTGHANAGLSRSRSQRHHSRSPTRPNHAAFSRYAGAPAPPPTMNPIQTQVGPMYEYQAMQAMSAVPYSPFVEQYSVLSMVSMQMYDHPPPSQGMTSPANPIGPASTTSRWTISAKICFSGSTWIPLDLSF